MLVVVAMLLYYDDRACPSLHSKCLVLESSCYHFHVIITMLQTNTNAYTSLSITKKPCIYLP